MDCHLKVTADNIVLFEFDHTRDKNYNVSAMTTMRDTKFQEEIAKCELLCANCHRIRTHKQRLDGRIKPSGGRPRKLSPDGTQANTRPLSADALPSLLLG